VWPRSPRRPARPQRARLRPRPRDLISLDGRALRLAVEHGEEALPGLLRTLDGAGIAMESIQLARPSLDDVFLTVTGRSQREDPP